jgi:RNA polymerase sigma factor (TIGR02999 family)
MNPPPDIPAVSDADASQSADVLFDAVYSRLKAMAGRQLAHSPGQASLDTTALVHELYLRVSTNRELAFSHPAQFFAYAARAMRHLLRDRARDRLRQRAGGGWVRMTLTGSEPIAITSAEQALALDEALEKLAHTDARAAQVVEMRYFAGLSLEQVADTLDLARRTVDRDWRFARAFLHDQLH